METAKKALLLLEDGTLFEGKAFGATGTATGEICFNTGMTGYQEGLYRSFLFRTDIDHEYGACRELWG
ncbi:carbamoyl-phosphate synthase small chain [Filimonas sp.]|nr:carbamoyl-phosphate synthase small chain [Filimonas sp.]